MEGVSGHRSTDDGAAHRSSGACLQEICAARLMPGVRVEGEEAQMFGGHGRCQCGQESPHLFSNGLRRAWHRQHKTLLNTDGGLF